MQKLFRLSVTRWLLVFLLLLCCPFLANAVPQVVAEPPTFDEYLSRTWNVEHGLPQTSVLSIVQDAQGFIWLATQNGLSKFDGQNFTVYNTANTPALPSNLITTIFIDQQQVLWVGTANGLARKTSQGFTEITYQQQRLGNINAISQLADGSVFIGSDQLYAWHEEQLHIVAEHQLPVYSLTANNTTLWIGSRDGLATLTPTDKQSGNANNRLEANALAFDYQWHAAPAQEKALRIKAITPDGALCWVGTSQGLYQFNGEQWQPVSLPSSVENADVEMIFIDKNQVIWVSTYLALYRFYQGQLLETLPRQQYLSFAWIQTMLEDQHGNLWLGSRSSGLRRLRPSITERYGTDIGLPDAYSWAVAQWQGALWVGTNNGLVQLNNDRFETVIDTEQLPSPMVYSLLVDDTNRLWVGTRAGVSVINAETLQVEQKFAELSHLLVTTMAQQHDRVWVGTNGGLYYINQQQMHPVDYAPLQQAPIRFVLPDNNDRLWIGSENGLYLHEQGQFRRSSHPVLSSTFITYITKLPDNTLLVGTFDQGFFIGDVGNWQQFNQHDGLPSDGVMHATVVDEFLVVSNFQGLYRLFFPALQQGEVTQLYMLIDDRRPEAASDSHRCCNGAGSSKGLRFNGKLWYPTLNGVVALPLSNLRYLAAMPQPVVDNIRTAEASYTEGPISLPADQHDWQIRFTAPYYIQSSSLLFRYQLKGYDEAWVEAGQRREAFYTNLPHGDYQFRVQVQAANDYRWSDAATFDIELQAHWYEYFWVKLAIALSIIGLLLLAYRMRLQAMARARQRLEAIVEERTHALFLANQRLEQLSVQDALTGLYNRHYLDMNIDSFMSRANRHAEPLVWVLLDLDFFKQINDTLGHQTGDRILQAVADILRQNSRSSDHLIRWGGEEFLLILENSETCQLALQRLQQAIRSYNWSELAGAPVALTCSMGALVQPRYGDWQQSLHLADQALYWVKDHGRDGYLLLQLTDFALQQKKLPSGTDIMQLVSQGWLSANSSKTLPDNVETNQTQ